MKSHNGIYIPEGDSDELFPKPAPTEQEQLTKLLQTIIARSDLDAVTIAVLNCYNKSSGPESVFLQPAVEIISTLRQLKYKGYI